MSKFKDALNQITDPAVAGAKAEFSKLISDGKASSKAFIKASAEQLEKWIIAVGKKEMSRAEFDELVSSQKILAKNFVLSQGISARKRAEKLTVNALEIAATKIIPGLLSAI